MTHMLTAERLRELFVYDAETGVFTRRVGRGNRAPAGAVAGCSNSGGYLVIMIDGVLYFAHRLAVLYMTGQWPVGDVDHKNCVRNDNRFANLREATRSQNARNARRSTANTSGFKGVTYSQKDRTWRAQITHKGRNQSLGLFPTAEQAHAAYCKAASAFEPEFARAA